MSILKATQQEQDNFFWKIIDESNDVKDFDWEEYDQDQHIDQMIDLLSKTDKDHLIVFEKVMQQQLHRLYTAEIAELYIVLNNDFDVEDDVIDFDDTISDDAFIYFRCWLLLKGKDFVEEISSDIQNFVNGEYSFDIGECDAEELLYVADLANEEMTGIEESEEIRDAIYESFPDVVNYDDVDVKMNREVKGGTALQKAYPELVEEICDVRSDVEE
ncbi:DUF4240 domain-containing protein [Myroides odoratimimus]|uniref:DUF4240 domain-containing protein n=1 Tax=Myroides odoratimimus CCUG 10230 TaxID=883150 RepID=A0ABP2N9N9_9FLAO|nr:MULTISPECIES: DUF4240 domain-containing protein [Myroides]AJA69954.1 Protein of unknown function DUF4240 [Myroides sp. A21]EHO08465.1 hypothetical protein HMPREF9712_02127 [Myroides odoratimimus CCUG 10230]EPH12332.1 hypothetical protein HMPREF9713_01173 [Myroides odoratimimus CCUG 12700]MDM1058268.1 DUF4240 domain-containing protein [Myroides odoratimimus]MDM1410320.1 DUF4240 domain-containing protein [Myroides odoratimimus]